MPHLSIEYSANIDDIIDMDHLCCKLSQAVLATNLFEIGAIRIRAIRCEHYIVADRAPENGFVDLKLRIGSGRTQEQKTHAGAMIFSAAQEALASLSDTPHFALSLEVQEIDPQLSWKHNTIHTRLRHPNASSGERHVCS